MLPVDLTAPEGAEKEIGLLLAVLDDVTEEWTSELGTIPDTHLLWQPFPGGHSIGALILHIVDVEAHWLHTVGAGQTRSEEELKTLLSEETQQYAVQWPVPPVRPLAWYLEQHTAVRRRSHELVLALNDPDHRGRRDDGKEFTLRWLLNHVISHEAYHGGQAVLLELIQQKTKG